jgi:hypothetical protein
LRQNDSDLTANIDDAQAKFTGDHVFIPIDELLGYIIDRQFMAIDRATLHVKLRELRNRWADTGYRFEAMAGRVGRLRLECKNPECDVSMETAQEAVEALVRPNT